MTEKEHISNKPEIVRFHFERFDVRSGNGKIIKKSDNVYYGEKIRLVVFILNAKKGDTVRFSLQLWNEKATARNLQKKRPSFSNQVCDADMKIRNISNIPHITEFSSSLQPTSYNQYYAFSHWFTIPIDWYQLIEINEDSSSVTDSDKIISTNTHTQCLTATLDSRALNVKNQELIQQSRFNLIETKDLLHIQLQPVYRRNQEELTGLLNKEGIKTTINESLEHKSIFTNHEQTQKLAESFTHYIYNLSYEDESYTTLLKYIQEYTQKLKIIKNDYLKSYVSVWLKRHPLFKEQYNEYSEPSTEFDRNKYHYCLNYTHKDNLEKFRKTYKHKLYLLELYIIGNGGYEENIEYYTKKKLKSESRRQENDINLCQFQIERLTNLKTQTLKEIEFHKEKLAIFQRNVEECSRYVYKESKNISLYIHILSPTSDIVKEMYLIEK